MTGDVDEDKKENPAMTNNTIQVKVDYPLVELTFGIFALTGHQGEPSMWMRQVAPVVRDVGPVRRDGTGRWRVTVCQDVPLMPYARKELETAAAQRFDDAQTGRTRW